MSEFTGDAISAQDFSNDPDHTVKLAFRSETVTYICDEDRRLMLVLGIDKGVPRPPLSSEELDDLPEQALSDSFDDAAGSAEWLR